jgi:superfamily II DNA or RNA helicase
LNSLLLRIGSRAIAVPEFILVHAAPGGGKSLLPVLAAHQLIERFGMADKVCWVVPNGSLRRQAVDAFRQSGWAARYLGHRLEVMESTNVVNPSKGTAGYVTTYQALTCDGAGINCEEFRRHRYILVLDEFHHCPLNQAYQRAVQPLGELSAVTIGMTGTVDRADRCPIYMLPYGTDGMVKKEDSEAIRWINYPIVQATKEKAIIRVHFRYSEGKAGWYGPDGQYREADRLGDDRDALFSALRTQYAHHLLDACTFDWLACKADNNRSKMLVVCADTHQAQIMLKRLRARVPDADVATYKEDLPDETVERFRTRDKPSALVTVAMAYEGLDVPSITHIACLTHIRSRPWIEQMIARGWRFDPKGPRWAEQVLRAFVPGDQAMLDCVRAIENQQEEAVRSLREVMDGPPSEPRRDGGVTPSQPASDITPVTSALTESWASELHGPSLTPEETTHYESIAEDCGTRLTPVQVKQIVEEAEKRKCQMPRRDPDGGLEPTARQRIKALRDMLNRLVNQAAGGRGDQCAMINSSLKVRFGERAGMDEQRLNAAISYMRSQLEGGLIKQ